jgi:hypothetical protein
MCKIQGEEHLFPHHWIKSIKTVDNSIETVDKSAKLWKTYLICVGFWLQIVDVCVHKGGKELTWLWMISNEVFFYPLSPFQFTPPGEEVLVFNAYIYGSTASIPHLYA